MELDINQILKYLPHRYPFLLVDALVIKVRKGGRVNLQSVLITYGVNREGYREILGLSLSDGKS